MECAVSGGISYRYSNSGVSADGTSRPNRSTLQSSSAIRQAAATSGTGPRLMSETVLHIWRSANATHVSLLAGQNVTMVTLRNRDMLHMCSICRRR